MMKVKSLIAELKNLNQDKEVKLECPNGLLVDPKIKNHLLERYPVNYSQKNIKEYVLTWQ